jgi:BolA protein
MSLQSRIEQKITAALMPEQLEVINESHLHAGHQPGFDGTGESHFRIRIVTSAFNDMNMVMRHRKINELLKEEIDRGLHALAIEAKTPDDTK